MGLSPFPVWRIARVMHKEFVLVFLCRPGATCDEVVPVPSLHMVVCDSLTFNSVAAALSVVLLVCWWLLLWVFERISFRLVGRG